MTRVLLIGGTSEIGLAIVRRLAQDGPVHATLVGRERTRLEDALGALGVGGEVEVLDADQLERHREVLDAVFSRAGRFDLVVLAVGVLGAQAGLDADPGESSRVMRVNFLGAGSLLIEALRRMRAHGGGTLVVLSSVAAERARAGNAIYGAAKAGLDALAQGLADSLAGTPVRVLVVRPGFVRTRMTAGLPIAPMAVSAAEVADATVRALAGKAHTIWVPGRLRYVFAVLRHLPRAVFRRLSL